MLHLVTDEHGLIPERHADCRVQPPRAGSQPRVHGRVPRCDVAPPGRTRRPLPVRHGDVGDRDVVVVSVATAVMMAGVREADPLPLVVPVDHRRQLRDPRPPDGTPVALGRQRPPVPARWPHPRLVAVGGRT